MVSPLKQPLPPPPVFNHVDGAPDWANALFSNGDLTLSERMFAVLSVLGVGDEAIHALLEQDLDTKKIPYNQKLATQLSVLVRALFFKNHAEALNALTPMAIEHKRLVLTSPNVPAALRDKVATEILERNLGKPAQTLNVNSLAVSASVTDLKALDKDLSFTLKRVAELEQAQARLTKANDAASKTILDTNKVIDV